ncbi:MAG: nitroreductase family protein [Acidobacteriota bacterium]
MSDPDHPKIASADHEILDVIRHRWSPRAFDAAGDVSDAELHRLFEAARWAPSSANEQPWRFVVASARRTPEAFAAMLDALNPKNQAWAKHAAALVLTAVRLTFERNGAPNTAAWYDAGQAVGFLSLQATADGLATRQMVGFDPERVRTASGMPTLFEPTVVIAIGRVGDPERLEVETHRNAELQPRQRRPIREFVFWGTWDGDLDKTLTS